MALKKWIFTEEAPVTSEREEIPEVVMNTTLRSTVIDLVKLGPSRWQPSPATHEAEAEIVRAEHEILEGRGKLIDFREACEKWKQAGRIKPKV